MKKLLLVITIAFASALFAQDGRIPTPPGPTPVPTPTPEDVDPLLNDSVCRDLLVQGIMQSGLDPQNYELRLIASKMDDESHSTFNSYVVTNLASKNKMVITVAVMFTPYAEKNI